MEDVRSCKDEAGMLFGLYQYSSNTILLVLKELQ